MEAIKYFISNLLAWLMGLFLLLMALVLLPAGQFWLSCAVAVLGVIVIIVAKNKRAKPSGKISTVLMSLIGLFIAIGVLGDDSIGTEHAQTSQDQQANQVAQIPSPPPVSTPAPPPEPIKYDLVSTHAPARGATSCY